MVAFDETMYEVDEGTPYVTVCVNLTKPEHDIQDENVFVEVYDDPSSIYVPSNATPASKTLISTNGASLMVYTSSYSTFHSKFFYAESCQWG